MCGGAAAGIQPLGALLASQICNNTKTVHICDDERDDGVSVKGGRGEAMGKAVTGVSFYHHTWSEVQYVRFVHMDLWSLFITPISH